MKIYRQSEVSQKYREKLLHKFGDQTKENKLAKQDGYQTPPHCSEYTILNQPERPSKLYSLKDTSHSTCTSSSPDEPSFLLPSMASRQLPAFPSTCTVTPFRPELSDLEADRFVAQAAASRMGSYYRKNLAKLNKQYLEAIAMYKPVTRVQFYVQYIREKLPELKDEKVCTALARMLEEIYLSWPSDQKGSLFEDQMIIESHKIEDFLGTDRPKVDFFRSAEAALLFAIFCKQTAFNLVLVSDAFRDKDPHMMQQLRQASKRLVRRCFEKLEPSLLEIYQNF